MKIYKTKWYLAERQESEHHYQDLGPFLTETAAYAYMYQTAKVQDPMRPTQRLQERKPAFRSRLVTTVRGSRILAYPRLYRILL